MTRPTVSHLQELDGSIELLHVRQELVEVVAWARTDALLHLRMRRGQRCMTWSATLSDSCHGTLPPRAL